MGYADERAVAYLKVGPRALFLYRADGRLEQRRVQCVLDFFCLAAQRRRGVGRALFEEALAVLQLRPEHLAYDRPSPLMTAFLLKHFGLAHDLQPNRFALLKGFWDS